MKLDTENTHNASYLAMLRQWKCHKVVRAGKISFLARDEQNQQLMIHAEPSNMPFAVPLDFLDRHSPERGGYFVVYEDGYISYSPAEPFEAGYHTLEPVGCSSGTVGAGDDAASPQPIEAPMARPLIDPAHEPDRSVIFTFTMRGIGDNSFEPHVLDAMDEYAKYVKEHRNSDHQESRENPYTASNGVAVKWFNNDVDGDYVAQSDWGKTDLEATEPTPGVSLQNLDVLETDMPPHQLRVMEELAQLSLRLQALHIFIYDENSKFGSLSELEQGLLRSQAKHMSNYQEVLMARVAAFS